MIVEKGVQGFWLTSFKNVELLASMIQPHDEPILEHLNNVKVDFSAEPMVSAGGLTLGLTLRWLVDPRVTQSFAVADGRVAVV